MAFRHLAQTPVAERVVRLCLAQMKSLPHPALAEGCRLLTRLCAGPRAHLRKVREAGGEALALAARLL